MVTPQVHFVDRVHQVIVLQTEFVEITIVRISRRNLFCFIPPSLRAILEFWYIESGPLDRLWSLVCKLKGDSLQLYLLIDN